MAITWMRFSSRAQASKEASMSRPASRFIGKLTKSQQQQLQHLKDHGETPRVRHRAHAILLSYQGSTIIELMKVFQTSRNTITQWLDRWDSEAIAGLADKPRPGAPPKLTEQEQASVLELLGQSPQNPAAVLPEIKQQIGKEISRSTLKRIAKKSGLSWKRMRRSLASKRDPKNFATQERIAGIEGRSDGSC